MERWAYEYFRRQAIEDRCKQEAQWLIDNSKDSIRKMAKEFCISKSQLHRDLHELKAKKKAVVHLIVPNHRY